MRGPGAQWPFSALRKQSHQIVTLGRSAAWKNAIMNLTFLVFVEHDGESVGVVRDRAGVAWLSDSTERVCGPRLDDLRPEHVGLADDRMLIGGLLPPGAVSAEVVDDAGERHVAAAANGAYVTVLDQPATGRPCPVCCRDDEGTPVAPGLPASWERTAVLDAEESCPACGAVSWDEVRPNDGSRGSRGALGGGMEPTPLVVCRSCGYEESVGSWVIAERRPDADPEAAARARRAFEQAQQERHRALLTEVEFPIYAAEGFSAGIAGHGGPSSGTGNVHRVTQISVAQPTKAHGPEPRLIIETAVNDEFQDSEQALARRELEGWLHEEMPPPAVERSEAGRAIAWHSVDRERRKLAAHAQVSERSLVLDGRPTSFAFLAVGERWVAVHRLPALTITVSASKIDPDALSIRPIDRPVEELLGNHGE
jgi:hypothetical protein